jgi:hypothetical protein
VRSCTQQSTAQLSPVGEDDADESEAKESSLSKPIVAKQAEKKEVEFKIGPVEQQIKERSLGACGDRCAHLGALQVVQHSLHRLYIRKQRLSADYS